MTNAKRTLSFLMVFLMLVSFASCSEPAPAEQPDSTSAENTPAETASAETAETAPPRLLPDIPETADFGGRDIHFLVWTFAPWSGTVREYRDIFAEGLTGEAINDVVFNRNLLLQQNYQVQITQERMDINAIDGAVGKAINAGDATYSAVYPRLYEAPGMYQKAYFHNLFDVPHIDLTKPWWDQNCVASLSTCGILPAVATSINVNDKDATVGIAFNKTIGENNGVEDLYTLVREGTWTIDRAAAIAERCNQDLNGDGKTTVDDIYGFLGKSDVMDAFWHGAGGLLVTKDAEDSFVFSFGSEYDIDTALAVIDFMNQPWFYNQHVKESGTLNDTRHRQYFETGHAMLYWMRLDEVTDMRAGEADFGILPTPKYTEEQELYYSFVSQHTTGLLSIPRTNAGENLEQIGLILEAMAAESHYTLLPAYIEESLKSKYSRDVQSADMLDIIISNRVFDPMNIYNFGRFADTFVNLAANNTTDLASVLQRSQRVIDKNIERLNSVFAEMAENQP